MGEVIQFPSKGDRAKHQFKKELKEARKKVEEPVKERTYEELVAGIVTDDGALDISKLDEVTPVGYNNGTWCDVTDGPCRCGAWHSKSDNKE